jgi:alkylhydroperoxidase/carboxymuconolactone decarboxylase family protein YurZ
VDPTRAEIGRALADQLFPDRAGRPPAPLPEGMPASVADLRRLVLEHAFADSWARPGLEHRTKSFVTVAFLIAQGSERELERHFNAALSLGITKAELIEVIIHAAVYCGIPRAHAALAVATEVFAARDNSPPEVA